MRVALIALLLVAGCQPQTTTESFVPAICVCCGFATATDHAPEPNPAPDDSQVCSTCDGEGWLGDGQPRSDCPDCNTEWDNHVFSEPPKGGDLESTAEVTPVQQVYSDTPDAIAEAVRTGKQVLVHFYFDGCGPCVQFDNDVLADESVADRLEDFVLLRIDTKEKLIDGTERGDAWANALGVKTIGCPAECVMRTDGNIYGGLRNPPRTPDAYLSYLNQIEANQ